MTPDYFHNLIWSYSYAVDVIILMDRVERKPDVAASEHHRHRPAYTSAQSDQRLLVSFPQIDILFFFLLIINVSSDKVCFKRFDFTCI